MSEGVDILALAAERVWAARRWLAAAGAMNDSPQAEIAYQNALVAVEAAERDMRGVRETIAALSTGRGERAMSGRLTAQDIRFPLVELDIVETEEKP